MLNPFALPLLACLAAALASCHEAAHSQSASETASGPATEAREGAGAPPPGMRLAIQLIASRSPSHLAPAAAPATEPSHDLYGQGGAASANASSADPPGFRLTVPLCRRAERLSDPLARTAECAQLLEAAREQAKACKQAFENGDDKYVLSPACRQAAGFR